MENTEVNLTLLADYFTSYNQNKKLGLDCQLKLLKKIQIFFAVQQLSEKTQKALLPL